MEDRGALQLSIPGIHAEVAGAGPTVVLNHDGLLDSAAWGTMFEALSTTHRVVRWDRRGYGRSDSPTGPYSSVDDLVRVIRAASDAPVTMIGCSFGGFLALRCALDHPELVSALVLLGPIVTGLPLSEHFLTRGGREVPGPHAAVERQIEFWSETDPWYVAPANTAARQRLREVLEASPNNLGPHEDGAVEPDRPALPRLGEIAVPTLLLVGEADHPDVHAHSGAIEAAIPGARRTVLSGCGHSPHLEVPDALDRVLREFLDAH
ncbi:alpha/beta fold hydrolase [Nocardia sp. NPDC050406]|uniref:alpha/beta fold hydrolase n=1 Tax=Nocardia sp. NPDC050406 TaxID=3364318 RepID=UPI00378B868D